MRRRRGGLGRAWSVDRLGVVWVAVALAAASVPWVWPSWWWRLGVAVHLVAALVAVRVRVRRRLRRRHAVARWLEWVNLRGMGAAVVFGAALMGEAMRRDEARRTGGDGS